MRSYGKFQEKHQGYNSSESFVTFHNAEYKIYANYFESSFYHQKVKGNLMSLYCNSIAKSTEIFIY